MRLSPPGCRSSACKTRPASPSLPPKGSCLPRAAKSMCARSCRGDHLACIKRERSFPFSALIRSPATGIVKYMKRKCAHTGAPPLTCRLTFEIVAVFRMNDLSALMLTLGAADFSRRTKVLRFRPQAYLHKTPSIIPQPQDKIKPPPKNRQGPTTNQSPSTNYGCGAPITPGFGQRLFFMSHSRFRSSGVGFK